MRVAARSGSIQPGKKRYYHSQLDNVLETCAKGVLIRARLALPSPIKNGKPASAFGRTSTADLKSLHNKRRIRPATSDRQSGTRINRFASAANLKFLSVLLQARHRNFKFKAALEILSC